jgi:hypothetical protein
MREYEELIELSTFTAQDDPAALGIIAAETSGRYDLYIYTFEYRTDLFCYLIGKFQTFNMADPDLTLGEAA